MTAFVGPNGSGKSSILDALRFMADAARIGLPAALADRQGIVAVRRWSSGTPHRVRLGVHLTTSVGPAYYGFELASSTKAEYHVQREHAWIEHGDERHEYERSADAWSIVPEGLHPPLDILGLALTLIAGDRRFQPLHEALTRIEVYTVFPEALASAQRYDPRRPMYPDGRNWISILQDQPEQTWKPELLAALHHITGDITDIGLDRAGGYLSASFAHDVDGETKWLDAFQESDGTLRVAGILSALLQEPPLLAIGIEEPELTVYPGALPLLHDFLVQASRRTQVLVTTHSPELLDRLDVDGIQVVERSEGVASVRPLALSQRDGVRKGLLTLGEVMLTEGLQQSLPA